MRDNETRLIVVLDKRLHFAIKSHAYQQHLLLKEWVTTALTKALIAEQEEGVYEPTKENREKKRPFRKKKWDL